MPFSFSWALWVFSALAVFVAKEVYGESKRRRLPASIAWVGPRNEVFSMLRAWKREYTAGLKTVEEGYTKYNTKGKLFAVLDTAGRSQVILPKEQMPWLVSHSDDILCEREARDTKFGTKYLIPIMSPEMNDQFILAIRRDLTRNLAGTQKIVFDVLRQSLDATLERANSSWHEINLIEILTPAISNAIKRIVVGQELCGDEAFRATFERFHGSLGICAILIGQFVPYFLTKPFGHLASIPVAYYRKKVLKYIIPEVQARLDAIELAKTDPAFDYKQPMDVIHFVIGTCKNKSTNDISESVVALTLAALHTTNISTISTFIDILSSPPELGYFDAIHDEAVSVFQTEEDWLKIASLHSLTQTDSALRESMRLNPIFGRGVLHEVMHKNGVTLPDGNHLPQGQWLGVSLTGISMDERYYPDPSKYDPWRFSRAREERQSLGSDSDNKLNGSFLSTSEDRFAVFGYGKHTCPGRWFASHLMKLILAYIAFHYEIAPIAVRPPNMIIGDCIVAPRNVNIRIRKRRSAVA